MQAWDKLIFLKVEAPLWTFSRALKEVVKQDAVPVMFLFKYERQAVCLN